MSPIDPSQFEWQVGNATADAHKLTADLQELDAAYALTAWNLAAPGKSYADPDIRVRCYLHLLQDNWWCEVYVAWGVTAEIADPNPALFLHNGEQIAANFEEVSGVPFPWHDVRLYTNGMNWTQIGRQTA